MILPVYNEVLSIVIVNLTTSTAHILWKMRKSVEH